VVFLSLSRHMSAQYLKEDYGQEEQEDEREGKEKYMNHMKRKQHLNI
jgi:hypothetical protein